MRPHRNRVALRHFAAATVLLGLFLHRATSFAKVKIACVGASTTSGDGSSAGHHYPDELQRLVAADEVRNFGASGTTMLRNVSATYWKTTQFTQALAYLPDVVIIWFGGNDAKPENWTTHKGEFLGDYETMIHMFQDLPSHPRTYVILSLVIHDTGGIPKAVVDSEVIPLVRQAAADTGSGVIDVHGQLADHPEYFPDGIHPNDPGTLAIAKVVYAALTAPLPDGGADAPASDAAPAAAQDGNVTEASPAPPPEVGGTDSGGPPPPGEAPPDAAVTSTDAAASANPALDAGSDGPASSAHQSHGGGCAIGGVSLSAPAHALALLLALVALLPLILAAGHRARRRRFPHIGQSS
jgi:lysophospholipase L1-like esterase